MSEENSQNLEPEKSTTEECVQPGEVHDENIANKNNASTKEERKKLRASGSAKYVSADHSFNVTEGFNQHGDFIMHELRNILIFGAHGTGKSVIVNNILSQLVMRYAPDDIYVKYLSNKGSVIQPESDVPGVNTGCTGLAACDICIGSDASGYTSVAEALESAATICAARIGVLMQNGVDNIDAYKTFKGRNMARVIYVLDVSMSKFNSPAVSGYLNMITSMSDKLGVYIILTALDGIPIPYQLYDKFQARVYTGGLRSNLYAEMIGGHTPEANDTKCGNAWLYVKDASNQLIKVQSPYYRKAVLKKVVAREVKPCGVEFDDNALAQLKILYQL